MVHYVIHIISTFSDETACEEANIYQNTPLIYLIEHRFAICLLPLYIYHGSEVTWATSKFVNKFNETVTWDEERSCEAAMGGGGRAARCFEC